MMCLISVGTPTPGGMIVGVSGGRASDSNESLYGVFSMTCLVQCGRSFWMLVSESISMLLFWMVLTVSSPFHLEASGLPGPFRSGCPSSPLLFPIYRVSPWLARVMAEGYQPVGMNPRTELCSRLEMRMTAIELLSALATYRSLRLLSIRRASGVEPSGARGVRVVDRRSRICRLLVSITWTVLSFEQAMKRRPSSEIFISFGFIPTWSVRMTLLDAVSMTLTDSLDQLETNRRLPSGVSATAPGLISTGMRARMLRAFVSKTTMLLGPSPVPRFAA